MLNRCKLLGGPFDGDAGEWCANDGTEPPATIFVLACDNPLCPQDGTHWYSQWVRGAETYNFEEEQDTYRLYVYADLAPGDSDRLSAREREPVAA